MRFPLGTPFKSTAYSDATQARDRRGRVLLCARIVLRFLHQRSRAHHTVRFFPRFLFGSCMTAYACLLRGNRLMYRINYEDLLEAKRLFQQAIDLDPHFALAYSRSAACDNFLSMKRGCTDSLPMLSRAKASRRWGSLVRSLANYWRLQRRRRSGLPGRCFRTGYHTATGPWPGGPGDFEATAALIPRSQKVCCRPGDRYMCLRLTTSL